MKPHAASPDNNIAAAKLGRVPLTIWDNSPYTSNVLPIVLSVPADRKRLTKGLQMAGVSPLLTPSVLGEKNKLTTAELHSLVFGHELRGHDYGYRIDADRFASITADGIANFSGNWGQWQNVRVTMEEGKLCVRAQYHSMCFEAFRNPGGTKAKLNEYILLNTQGSAFMFSQVK